MKALTLTYGISLVALGVSMTACAASESNQPQSVQPLSAHQLAHTKTSSHSAQAADFATRKPSADINFSHSFTGTPRAGETIPITLSLVDAYSTGTVTVRVIGSAGLNMLQANQTYTFDLGSSDARAIDLLVNANSDGLHVISVQAVTEGTDNQVATASYAIPINVGMDMKTAIARESARRLEKSSKGPDVVVMEAQEEIITSDE